MTLTDEQIRKLAGDYALWRSDSDLLAFARALLSASIADTAGAKPEPLVTLSGAQLLEAFNYVAPDHPNDPDQLECDVTIAYGEGHSGKGHYCWITDYPDEGAILLDGKQAEGIAAPPASSVADAAGASALRDRIKYLEKRLNDYQSAAGASEGQEPVAWRKRGYSQFQTGTPSRWLYEDGSDKPQVRDPANCDVEPLYTRPSAEIAALRERIAGMEKDADDAKRWRTLCRNLQQRNKLLQLTDLIDTIDAAIAKERQG